MTQPTALFLADILEDAGKPADIAEKCAAELRRLHAELERCKQVCAATAEAWREEAALAEPDFPLGHASTDVPLTVYSVKKAELVEPVALDWLHKWANQDDGEPETQWHEGYEAARRVVQIHLTTPPQRPAEPVPDSKHATIAEWWADKQRKPLTEEEIQELSEQHKFDSRMVKFVRIIERAHGIT